MAALLPGLLVVAGAAQTQDSLSGRSPASLEFALTSVPAPPHRTGLTRPLGWHDPVHRPGWSQGNQDVVVDMLLGHLKNGFFIEAGAYDGEEFSNTLFAESYRNWTGLLVEANPHYVKKVLSRRRRAAVLAGGLSTSGNVTSFPFVLAGPRGGIVDLMDRKDMAFTRNRIQKKLMWAKRPPEGAPLGRVVDVQCFPLVSVLALIDGSTFPIHYFSLDTEGSEPLILAGLPKAFFDRVGVMTVEHNEIPQRQQGIAAHFRGLGWKEVYLHKGSGWAHAKKLPSSLSEGVHGLSRFDGMFINPAFFAAHAIPLPDPVWIGPPLDKYQAGVEF